ncbi:efflux RND transporter periplasmic adaptor subunit [Microvirga sp. 3-52]|uniref:efflux RND transporter periplasmic adaptor subunit n=1 Tax=Microvirga sp. 3-52 TaxID=2792425 RepID=UPI001ACE04F1|nr:efflux RND transporter periplasmic adaptor subunit [Microvirga sp. 3-52]MBO1905290.1 efflux RND transporter periplasmic adaptor subunit [Microvirga sp. 3-52]MBS7452621.1 efflux RND transporter periplasmic adaptor subunit [Microvirga sp. 3-52]
MFIRTNGALRRIQAILVGLGLLTTIAAAAVAHEGHDHGAPPPAAVTTGNPRVTAQSDAYELVGVLRGDRLGIYLDRFSSNEPVTDAKIAVTVGGDEEAQAEAAPDGTYTVLSPKFAGEGPLELIFAVTAPSGDDLLIGTLQLPAKAVAAAPAPGRASPLQVLQNTPTVRFGSIEVATPYVSAGVALALGFLLGLVARSRRKLVPVAGLALVLLAVSTAYAFAHEGHDHGADAAKAALPAGDTPRRLPDGTVFVPKPSQRLLNVRTTLTKPEEAQKAVSLIGRVIADPNRSGLVQSINGGRIIAPDKGLPRIGQAVRKGDVLALVEQAVPQADRTTLSERVGEIEQEIAVAETKLKRVRQLSDRGVAPPSQVTDAEIELEGLRRRREIVRQTRIESEVLRAPIDGTIAAARVVAGQVVASQDVIFQIVDPKGLWVEALVYGEIDPAKVTGASATAVDGTPLQLTFQGFSKTLQQQATVVQFAVENPPGNLSVGSPVTVFAQNGASVRDIIMPRDAVVRGANGEAVVWRHTDPERFEARPVRTEPFDATRLVIRAGLSEGERVVIRGSELINQIR